MGIYGKMARCERYFERRGYERVRSFPGVTVVLLMQRHGADYRAHIELEWLNEVRHDSIDRRLENLSASSALLTHFVIWVGLTVQGQDAISCFRPRRQRVNEDDRKAVRDVHPTEPQSV